MLNEVFGNCPQIKTMDFLLSTYSGQFNKTQLAKGSNISRPTLDNFIDDFIKYELITKTNDLYELNEKSEVVKLFEKANILLADMEMKIQKNSFTHEIDNCSDEEFGDWLDEAFDNMLSEEEYQEKIEKKEEILVNKKEYEYLLNFYENNTLNSDSNKTLEISIEKNNLTDVFLGQYVFFENDPKILENIFPDKSSENAGVI
ncbi:winged helix-turn-helix domain-containing protein [Methanobrevibacter sp. OttesenSCG-928-K11]|nr:winged helix-turn-helix domain-containing protein [Methanobrevibacter sp. OttesenSCG-928-K11]